MFYLKTSIGAVMEDPLKNYFLSLGDQLAKPRT